MKDENAPEFDYVAEYNKLKEGMYIDDGSGTGFNEDGTPTDEYNQAKWEIISADYINAFGDGDETLSA